MKYRAEIDGLRALAVLPVILFHAGFELFSGGFVGVDVFFVISGYLITTILIEDIDKKRFSIVNFYERRARRILPALTFVLFISSLFAWILLTDEALNQFGSSLIGVSLFVSNIVFLKQEGYFEESTELNPLLHTWSLAVEEQFYVLFPLFLILTWRFGKSRVFWTIILMSVISLSISEWGWRNESTVNFYFGLTRAWELFAGSIAAFVLYKRGILKNDLFALLGLAAVVFSIFVYDENTPFPSLYTLLPILGIILIIVFADKDTYVAKLLSFKIFVGIGLISYSAYLWHQPLFAFTRVFNNQFKIDALISSVLIGVTFICAFFSWKFIEKPFRDKHLIQRKTVFLSGFVALVIILAIGYASKEVTNGREYKLAKILSENEFVYFQNMDERKFMEGRLIYPLSDVDTVVVGSSRVLQINSEIMGEKIQNFSVSGSSIEDNIALGLEALTKLKYRNIYIAADPWLINKNNRRDRYKTISYLYKHWHRLMLNNENPISFLDLGDSYIDGDNYISLLNRIRNIISFENRTIPIPTDGGTETVAKRSYDGSLIYNDVYSSRVRDISLGFEELLNYAMDDFDYDHQSIRNLEMFVSYLQSNGVNIIFILSPYHPELYQQMVFKKPIFLEIENWFRDFAYRNNISIIGSYNGALVDCDDNDFYDGMHPKGSAMIKLFKTN